MGVLIIKNIHKYTWEQHTKDLKTIIDYIITKQDLKLKIQDVRVYIEDQIVGQITTFTSQIFVSLYVHN
jgi:hypothetical protein